MARIGSGNVFGKDWMNLIRQTSWNCDKADTQQSTAIDPSDTFFTEGTPQQQEVTVEIGSSSSGQSLGGKSILLMASGKSGGKKTNFSKLVTQLASRVECGHEDMEDKDISWPIKKYVRQFLRKPDSQLAEIAQQFIADAQGPLAVWGDIVDASFQDILCGEVDAVDPTALEYWDTVDRCILRPFGYSATGQEVTGSDLELGDFARRDRDVDDIYHRLLSDQHKSLLVVLEHRGIDIAAAKEAFMVYFFAKRVIAQLPAREHFDRHRPRSCTVDGENGGSLFDPAATDPCFNDDE